MRTKIFLSLFVSLFTVSSFAQQMPFGFIKNCMSYARTTATDELNKKHFTLIDRNVQKVNHKMLEGASYYSNESDRTPGIGEIAVISQITDKIQVTEISFINGTKNDYSKNYTEVYNQMVNFFKDERTFKSGKYNTNVGVFNRDKVYYYVYKNKEVPTIVVSNTKLDESYFEIVK